MKAYPNAPTATVVGSEHGFNYGVGTPHAVAVSAQQSNAESTSLLNTPPKARCCIWCCVGFLACLTLFLLLFFLIPRPPRAKYESTVVTFNPYVIVQTYSITNNNMYSLTMSDLDLDVTTTLTGGTDLVGHGTFAGNSSSITIPKNSKQEVSVVYNFGSTASENTLARQACFSAVGVKYVTSGTMDMKTWSTNFHNVDLGPWSVTYYC